MTALNIHHHNHDSRVEYRINLLNRSVLHSVYHQPWSKRRMRAKKGKSRKDWYKQQWPCHCWIAINIISAPSLRAIEYIHIKMNTAIFSELDRTLSVLNLRFLVWDEFFQRFSDKSIFSRPEKKSCFCSGFLMVWVNVLCYKTRWEHNIFVHN